MAAIDYSVTYGSLKIGGDSTTHKIDGPVTIRETEDELEVIVEFIACGSTVANYRTAEIQVRALAVPEKQLVIVHGALTILDLNPASYEAFHVNPSVELLEWEGNCDRAKRWRFVYRAQHPPNRLGGIAPQNTRRESFVALTYTASRQKIATIKGTYTATSLGGVGGATPTTARAQHTALFGDYRDAVLTTLGGTYELVSEGPLEDDDRDGLITFSATYREVVYTTSVGGIINETVVFSRQRGFKASPTRAAGRVQFSASVDKGTSTDLDAVWNSVRTALLTKAVAVFGDATTAIVEREERLPSSADNTVAGTLDLILVNAGYTQRKRALVSLSKDASARKTVVLNGTYHSNDAGTDAVAAHAADIGTWSTAVLAAIGGTFELLSDGPVVYDDDDQEATFTRVYRQVLHTTSAGGVIGESFSFTRTSAHVHGIDGDIAPVRGIVTFATNVDSTVNGKNALVGMYTGTIRAALTSRIETEFGGTAVVEGESLSVSPDGNRINVTMQVLLDGLGSNTFAYQETHGFIKLPRNVWRKLWDGNQDTYHFWTRGHAILAVVVVVSDEIGGIDDHEPEGAIPAPPPLAYGANGSGTWALDSPRSVEVGSRTIGVGPDGAQSVSLRTKTSVTRYRWVGDGSADVGRVSEGVSSVDTSDASVIETGFITSGASDG